MALLQNRRGDQGFGYGRGILFNDDRLGTGGMNAEGQLLSIGFGPTHEAHGLQTKPDNQTGQDQARQTLAGGYTRVVGGGVIEFAETGAVQ